MDEEREQDLRELQEERFSLTELQKTAGYSWLMGVATSQAEARKQSIFLRPLKSVDEAFEQEYQKGEIAGIELFMRLVDIRVAELTEEIKRRTSDEA